MAGGAKTGGRDGRGNLTTSINVKQRLARGTTEPAVPGRPRRLRVNFTNKGYRTHLNFEGGGLVWGFHHRGMRERLG